MKAIILAAGQGKRLEQFTNGKPKCLLKLGDETILEREIRQLQDAGISNKDIYVVGGYRHELLKNIAPELIYNSCFASKDNAYSLALGLEAVLDDDVLILDADLCFEQEILRDLIADIHDNVVLSKRSDDLSESTGIVQKYDGSVESIGKKYKDTGYVYISIFKVGRRTIRAFRDELQNPLHENTWYTKAMTELCKQHAFYNLVTEYKWHEIDFPEDYYETLSMFGWSEEN